MAINYGHLQLFKCLVFLLISGHWFACIWGLITSFEDGNYQQTWYVVFGYCSFAPMDGGEIEALALADPGNASLQEQYTFQLVRRRPRPPSRSQI